jgi:hypothetical protein
MVRSIDRCALITGIERASRGWCPSDLGPHGVATGRHRLHSAFRSRTGRLCAHRGSWTEQRDCGGAGPGLGGVPACTCRWPSMFTYCSCRPIPPSCSPPNTCGCRPMNRWSRACFADIDALEEEQLARCVVLQRQPELIRSTTLFPWWPHRLKKRQGHGEPRVNRREEGCSPLLMSQWY